MASQGLTVLVAAVVFGLVMGIFKAVEWILSKRNNINLQSGQSSTPGWSDTTGEHMLFKTELSAQLEKVSSEVRECSTVVSRIERHVERLAKQGDDLWKWHSKEDEDGIKVWYVSKGFKRAIESLTALLREESGTILKALKRIEDTSGDQ